MLHEKAAYIHVRAYCASFAMKMLQASRAVIVAQIIINFFSLSLSPYYRNYLAIFCFFFSFFSYFALASLKIFAYYFLFREKKSITERFLVLFLFFRCKKSVRKNRF